MSEPGKAVFLSYASQDAEAAKRIAELRPADLHQNQLSNLALLPFHDPVREEPRFLQAINEVGYMEHYRRACAWLAANPTKGKQ